MQKYHKPEHLFRGFGSKNDSAIDLSDQSWQLFDPKVRLGHESRLVFPYRWIRDQRSHEDSNNQSDDEEKNHCVLC